MSVSIEQKVENIKRIIVDCVKEEFKDSLLGSTITVYIKHPKYTPQGKAETAFYLGTSDDTLSDEAFKKKMDYHSERLVQRILDKASTEYRDSHRYPGNNRQIRYLGQVLSVGEPVESPQVDESDFLEIAEIAAGRNWYHKIKISDIGKDIKAEIVRLGVREIAKEIMDWVKDCI
jgi:hypothetical protein